jgi:hypothetical protein
MNITVTKLEYVFYVFLIYQQGANLSVYVSNTKLRVKRFRFIKPFIMSCDKLPFCNFIHGALSLLGIFLNPLHFDDQNHSNYMNNQVVTDNILT